MISARKVFIGMSLVALSTNVHAITLNDISDFFLNPDLTQMSANQLISKDNFFGKLSILSEDETEIMLSAAKRPNSLEATYIKLDEEWLFNDISFSYYAKNEENCLRQQKAYKKHLTKRLNDVTFSQHDDGFFWQLPNRDWAIWLTISHGINPFTQKVGCSSKVILVYSSLDSDSGDEDF